MARLELTSEQSEKTLDRLNHYPGRIVGYGIDLNGGIFAFAGMGGRRGLKGSSNNRDYNPDFEDIDGYSNYVRTQIHDLKLASGDPARTIYTAAREMGDWVGFSNGDHT